MYSIVFWVRSLQKPWLHHYIKNMLWDSGEEYILNVRRCKDIGHALLAMFVQNSQETRSVIVPFGRGGKLQSSDPYFMVPRWFVRIQYETSAYYNTITFVSLSTGPLYKHEFTYARVRSRTVWPRDTLSLVNSFSPYVYYIA